jgi:hypothetical protein
MRPSPDSAALRLAFTRTETRTLRKRDGTIVIEGRRFSAGPLPSSAPARGPLRKLGTLPHPPRGQAHGQSAQPAVSQDKTQNARSGTETARFEGLKSFVRALAVLPDGRLALGSDDYMVRLWDPFRLDGHTRPVWALAGARRPARLRALMTTRSGCGTRGPAPRQPGSRVTQPGSVRWRCCRTADSPHALTITRFGCGTQRPGQNVPA